MAGRKSDFTLTKLDDLFTTQAQRDEEQLSKIRDIPLELIDDFPDHPFKVRDDEDMMQLVESVKERERLELEREELRQCEIRKARIALSMLQPLQRERLMKNVCCGLSSRAIAKQEGVYYSSVDKSIAAAKKNFIKFYENL